MLVGDSDGGIGLLVGIDEGTDEGPSGLKLEDTAFCGSHNEIIQCLFFTRLYYEQTNLHYFADRLLIV